jgi:hypothetical protein
MKLSTDTLRVLYSLSTINNGMVFQKGKTLNVKSEPGDIIVHADIVEDLPVEFGIYNMKEFLLVIDKLFDDPVLKFNKNGINISSGSASCTYPYCDKRNITHHFDRLLFDDNDIVLEFKLGGEDLARLTTSASYLGLDRVDFYNKKNKLTAKVHKVDGEGKGNAATTSNKSTFELTLGDSPTKDNYNLVMHSSRLQLIGGDYEVKVVNMERILGKKIFMFNAKNKEYNIEYNIACLGHSTYGV